MEKRIITDFARNARHQLIKERKCLAVRALDFLVCAAVNENHCLCIRCEQHVLATRKHELWECPGHNLIAHEHLEKSAHVCSVGSGTFGLGSDFVQSRVGAARLVACK